MGFVRVHMDFCVSVSHLKAELLFLIDFSWTCSRTWSWRIQISGKPMWEGQDRQFVILPFFPAANKGLIFHLYCYYLVARNVLFCFFKKKWYKLLLGWYFSTDFNLNTNLQQWLISRCLQVKLSSETDAAGMCGFSWVLCENTRLTITSDICSYLQITAFW